MRALSREDGAGSRAPAGLPPAPSPSPTKGTIVADLAFVFTVVGFFALTGLLVTFCDRIVGPVETPAGKPEQAPTPTRREAVR